MSRHAWPLPPNNDIFDLRSEEERYRARKRERQARSASMPKCTQCRRNVVSVMRQQRGLMVCSGCLSDKAVEANDRYLEQIEMRRLREAIPAQRRAALDDLDRIERDLKVAHYTADLRPHLVALIEFVREHVLKDDR